MLYDVQSSIGLKSRLEYGNFFTDLEAAFEYKKLFFNERGDIELFSVEFSESETNNLIEDFLPGNKKEYNFNDGQFQLRESLLKKKDPVPSKISEFLGYDLVGVEGDGSLYSFHCHGIAEELEYKFKLRVNEHGLFTEVPNKGLVKDYLNDKSTRVEPVPWYIVKVKKIKC